MFKFLVLAASAALASAYTTPTTQCTDSCNPIAKPGLDEVVPAGTAYTVTWQPTTSGTVTIVLMKGPSTNILPLYAIAEGIANTGTYSWTPATDLEPTGDTGYGFQLINDADGTYQWSTQFGISNPAYSGSASASASASATASVPAGGSSYTPSSPGNGTISSAVTSQPAGPTGYSNSTVVVTSAGYSGGSATTLTVNTVASGATASASPSSSSTLSNGAVTTFGAASFVGVLGAVAALFAAL